MEVNIPRSVHTFLVMLNLRDLKGDIGPRVAQDGTRVRTTPQSGYAAGTADLRKQRETFVALHPDSLALFPRACSPWSSSPDS